MKARLQALLQRALDALRAAGELSLEGEPSIPVERARDPRHGHFASPLALGLARAARRKPRDIAEQIVARLPGAAEIERVEIAGPGFINFFISRAAFQALVAEVLERAGEYGRSQIGAGHRVQVEFVSSNPTGPLHVGHGRGAAYGAALAAVLAAAGFDVQREYYVNDAGRQMDILCLSVWLRYLQARGEPVEFPAGGYRGGYVREVAAALAARHGGRFAASAAELAAVPAAREHAQEPDRRLDALVSAARELLGAERWEEMHDFGLAAMVEDIRDDLGEFGVLFDRWFRESSLVADGEVERALGRLREAGHTYERDGALWFRSTDFDDEKDRVLVRANGQLTYFASDIAYHWNKLERGFERLIDVWGADHHGHVPRMKAALAALGGDPASLEVLLVQFAILYRGGERLPMSTRSGEFVTLRELRGEVGNDAARFFYVMRRCDQHLDFDLDLARSQSSDNPVYYVQYAHARICSVMRQLEEKGHRWTPEAGRAQLARLVEEHELGLLNTLSRYPEVVESAALAREPHQVAFYLRELANDFHTYYNSHTFLVAEDALRDARIALVNATGQVVRNGLGLLGVAAPESM